MKAWLVYPILCLLLSLFRSKQQIPVFLKLFLNMNKRCTCSEGSVKAVSTWLWWKIEKERRRTKNAQSPAGFEPTISRLLGSRSVCYATAPALKAVWIFFQVACSPTLASHDFRTAALLNSKPTERLKRLTGRLRKWPPGLKMTTQVLIILSGAVISNSSSFMSEIQG